MRCECDEKDKSLCGYHAEIVNEAITNAFQMAGKDGVSIPMRLCCPECNSLHIDENEFAKKPHHTHTCQVCGNVWRPAVVHTVGVKFLPGFKND